MALYEYHDTWPMDMLPINKVMAYKKMSDLSDITIENIIVSNSKQSVMFNYTSNMNKAEIYGKLKQLSAS